MSLMIKLSSNKPILVILVCIAFIAIPVIADRASNQEIIGANIGFGIASVIVIPLLVLSIIWYAMTFQGWKRVLLLLLAAGVIFLVAAIWITNERASNRVFCEEVVCGL